MKKSILEIYALAVCFVALLCFVIALGIGVYDLIQITNPEFTLNAYEYERHQSNEAFRGFPGRAALGRNRSRDSCGAHTKAGRRGHSTTRRELPNGTSVRAETRDAESHSDHDYPGDRRAGVCASLALDQANKSCKHGELNPLAHQDPH